jgi:hypothetical protein
MRLHKYMSCAKSFRIRRVTRPRVYPYRHHFPSAPRSRFFANANTNTDVDTFQDRQSADMNHSDHDAKRGLGLDPSLCFGLGGGVSEGTTTITVMMMTLMTTLGSVCWNCGDRHHEFAAVFSFMLLPARSDAFKCSSAPSFALFLSFLPMLTLVQLSFSFILV